MILLTPYTLGDLELRNRMVMAPMTRSRAVEGNVPHPAAFTYYAQRATAGLIVTEGSQVSPQGVGYIRTPGIYSPQQVRGWTKITSAVHKAGGRMFLQLWHVGRASHPDFHGGELPVAPSAIPVEGEVFTFEGRKKIPIPRALETGEIADIVEQYRKGAESAKRAGFDGVELHGANGYLLDQFLRDGSNKRDDKYGGSTQNRARFPLEVTHAVTDVWGPKRVGYKMSPHFTNRSMSDTDPRTTFSFLAKELDKIGIGYVHLVEFISGPFAPPPQARLASLIRQTFKGTLILNGGYEAQSANQAIETGSADLISFGSLFLANPDLPARFKIGANLNAPDSATFYEGEEKGYIDYPSM
ncbi:MAG: alkene reductase [Candidatus Thorarchaeota archaeon]|nr:MAG: alkene reductase [Candidatus Thorarchaeota archaeon]